MKGCITNNLLRVVMKIGIVSMHRVKNNGSFLQAYALYEKLKKGGNQVQFIDFYDELHKDVKQKKNFLKELLKNCKALFNIEYKKQLETNKHRDEFNSRYTGFLTEIGLSSKLEFCKDEEFDLVVIGSDEVFNICQYSDKKVEIPWELFGENIKAKKLVTYAASCGQTNLEKIYSLSLENKCSDLLNKFSSISVRDENTFNFVNKLANKQPSYNVDPVLWFNEFPLDKDYKKLKEKYLLVYAYTMRMNGEKEKRAILEYARKKGLKTICVNCYQPWCDIKITCSPFALLQYIKDAERVVTDTFHGTVFSIRNNTPFATIVRESNKNKLRSLLKQFDLANREVESIDCLEEVLDSKIDFVSTNQILDKERKNSEKYLNNIIG